MGSSRALITCQMIARGLKYESGSLEEHCTRVAFENDRKVSFLTTLTMVNAIVETGNRIVAAITQSPSNQLSGDNVKKSMEALKDLLLPEDNERKKRQAAKARKRLVEEVQQGPIKFKAMAHAKPKKQRR
jgi:hypothetical protein